MNAARRSLTDGYGTWLADLKTRIRGARQRAVLAANAELIGLYHDLGREILERQERGGWGAKVIHRLAFDLRQEFPQLRGLSARNLVYMRHFAQACRDGQLVQQTAAQLPWFHVVALLTKVADARERAWYADAAIAAGWSRAVLVAQIQSLAHARQGEFFLDLLFYHVRLKCFVAVELKAGDFRPEHAGQLNFYLSILDARVKCADDKPTIGLLLCRTKNRVVAEYSLSGIDKPIGVAAYELVRLLPEPLDTKLPSVAELEAELSQFVVANGREEPGDPLDVEPATDPGSSLGASPPR